MGRFRAIHVRDGDAGPIWSKSGKPLDRYFLDVVGLLRAALTGRFVLDCEIVVPIGEVLSFSALQGRLHPALSGRRKGDYCRLVAHAPCNYCDAVRILTQALLAS